MELSSLAMAATLVAADLLGKAVLDCGETGRSMPELGLDKLDLAGLAPAPGRSSTASALPTLSQCWVRALWNR